MESTTDPTPTPNPKPDGMSEDLLDVVTKFFANDASKTARWLLRARQVQRFYRDTNDNPSAASVRAVLVNKGLAYAESLQPDYKYKEVDDELDWDPAWLAQAKSLPSVLAHPTWRNLVNAITVWEEEKDIRGKLKTNRPEEESSPVRASFAVPEPRPAQAAGATPTPKPLAQPSHGHATRQAARQAATKEASTDESTNTSLQAKKKSQLPVRATKPSPSGDKQWLRTRPLSK